MVTEDSYIEDDDIPDIETQIASNVEQRTPCILVLDTSGSMGGQRIDALNRGLKVFEEALKSDDMAMQRVTLKILTFGGGGRSHLSIFVKEINVFECKAQHFRLRRTIPY